LFDEENRLSCTNKGPQMPSPSCIGSNLIDFIYDHAGVRKIKSAATPTIYPNQFYTDFGGGSGNQFKHIFIGSERILTKKTRIAPDREHWYYHPDHLGSTAMVTNEKSQLVDAIHYFPFGEVWLEERPSSLPADYFFTAKEFDPETGFYDFGARYLDPRFSKWMTADPALGGYLPGTGAAVAYQSPALANNWRTYLDLPGLGGVFHPRNLSMYAYAGNGPLSYIDPSGRQMWMSNYERGEYLQCKGMCHGYNFDPNTVRETTPEENALLMSATDLLTLGLTGGFRSASSLLFREAATEVPAVVAGGRSLILRPVEIEFPASGLSPSEQSLFRAHLAEQEATLNRLSLFSPEELALNLRNYPNVAPQIDKARRLAREYLPGPGRGRDAAHALDSVAGGYVNEFVGFRDPIQQRIGALWRTRASQIQPGREHMLTPRLDR
jgi:RHS repeat-associated protein